MSKKEFPAKTVVMLSGGIDSTTLAYSLRKRCSQLRGVMVDYGQHNYIQTRRAVNKISVSLHIPVEYIDARGIMRSFVGFTEAGRNDFYVREGIAPAGDYSIMHEEILGFVTILTIPATYTKAIGYNTVVAGFNRDDLRANKVESADIPKFQKHFSAALTTSRENAFQIVNPFEEMELEDIIRHATELRVPLDETWSCWEGFPRQCGVCPGCIVRRRGFKDAGINDPTLYQTCPQTQLVYNAASIGLVAEK